MTLSGEVFPASLSFCFPKEGDFEELEGGPDISLRSSRYPYMQCMQRRLTTPDPGYRLAIEKLATTKLRKQENMEKNNK